MSTSREFQSYVRLCPRKRIIYPFFNFFFFEREKVGNQICRCTCCDLHTYIKGRKRVVISAFIPRRLLYSNFQLEMHYSWVLQNKKKKVEAYSFQNLIKRINRKRKKKRCAISTTNDEKIINIHYNTRRRSWIGVFGVGRANSIVFEKNYTRRSFFLFFHCLYGCDSSLPFWCISSGLGFFLLLLLFVRESNLLLALCWIRSFFFFVAVNVI